MLLLNQAAPFSALFNMPVVTSNRPFLSFLGFPELTKTPSPTTESMDIPLITADGRGVSDLLRIPSLTAPNLTASSFFGVAELSKDWPG